MCKSNFLLCYSFHPFLHLIVCSRPIVCIYPPSTHILHHLFFVKKQKWFAQQSSHQRPPAPHPKGNPLNPLLSFSVVKSGS